MTLLKKLEAQLFGKWSKIVTQGGRLEKIPDDNSFLLSGIWINVQSKWIEIICIELPDVLSYGYGLMVSNCIIPPVPEPSKFNNPPRKEINNFPSDCRLDFLKLSSIASVKTTAIYEEMDSIICESPIVVTSENKINFQFSASIKYPENIELKMT